MPLITHNPPPLRLLPSKEHITHLGRHIPRPRRIPPAPLGQRTRIPLGPRRNPRPAASPFFTFTPSPIPSLRLRRSGHGSNAAHINDLDKPLKRLRRHIPAIRLVPPRPHTGSIGPQAGYHLVAGKRREPRLRQRGDVV
ncbi:hypothetical protein CPAR01_12930 [Colletotrichum paranaense]|uniref:Uncharacterized protein n=1 Tax=Colletotrichum paranaense TaxID=1914294 RepID=A0ABQ9S8K1_9PEZI|nr:uncharacterized protein CPAR01_12930 [Colletotrichum paranaense]KAK1528372.1 hypothetical protein CPAR01_12930 [Colletotrichum paranaense]